MILRLSLNFSEYTCGVHMHVWVHMHVVETFSDNLPACNSCKSCNSTHRGRATRLRGRTWTFAGGNTDNALQLSRIIFLTWSKSHLDDKTPSPVLTKQEDELLSQYSRHCYKRKRPLYLFFSLILLKRIIFFQTTFAHFVYVKEGLPLRELHLN